MQLEEVKKIADIEKQLSKLWEEQKGSKRVRACLFNLIIFAHEKHRVEYLRELVLSIVNKFPCRIIIVQGNSSVQDIKVSVSNELTGKGDTSFACDLIMIQAPENQLQRVPFIILPNLVPDLPIYLLTGQNLTESNDILPALEQFSSRIIFDAGCADNLPQFSKKVLEMMDAKPHLDFVDMDWLLTAGWRNALAEVFDCDTALQRLKTTKNIQIRYNDRTMDWFPFKETKAMYLAGWLAAQMEWRFVKQEKKNGTRILTYHSGNNDFDIVLFPKTEENLYTGAILGVEISSSDDYFYFISPVPNMAKVSVHISSLETCELPFTIPLPTLKSGFPYVQDLFFMPPSTHYRNMLKALAAMSKQ